MKLVTVIGARPQFIKAAPLCRAVRGAGHTEILIHTGQHYDDNMSGVFFDELDIPQPDLNLGIGSGHHGVQTGAMLAGLEKILLAEQPDWVVVYGDTNSTLAGALAGAKLNLKVAHVEAGLRSFNRTMPEEINRVVADHLSELLFCPSQTAVDNLTAEGISRGVHLVGDVMADALHFAAKRADARSSILDALGVQPGHYLLATVHRAENTDDVSRLSGILAAFEALPEPVVFPVHPRTRKAMAALGDRLAPHVKLIEPVSYLEMVSLAQAARLILTDSGGLQKEAYWLGVPCVTLRNETEWVETVEAGWNMIVGADTGKIIQAVKTFSSPVERPVLYGDGKAAQRCAELLADGVQ